MADVLVVNGLSFIGSHLCTHLLNEPDTHVYCLTDINDNDFENTNLLNELKSNENFSLINHSFVKPYSSNIKFDYIYYMLNAHISVPNDFRISVLQEAKNVFELCALCKAKLIFLSSYQIYGNIEESPINEQNFGNVNPIGEQSVFRETLRNIEGLAFDYKRQYNFPVKIARIFETYGPGMPNDSLIGNMIISALNNENIEIHGSGEQLMTFCYIEDLIDGIIKLSKTIDDFTGPVNLGNTSPRTITDLAEKIKSLINTDSKIVYLSPYKDEIERAVPDISLAQNIQWGYKFLHIYKGLKKTIEYFKSSKE
jgi:UDP-glucuronate decarboxylase